MKIVCMIPARLNSSRFQRKILAPLGEVTLLGAVIDAAKKVKLFDDVVVAGCSDEVIELAKDHGARAYLTDPDLPNGTMRIISAIEDNNIEGDVFVNWQADEPFITEDVIMTLINDQVKADIWTLKKSIDAETAKDSNIVKVVSDVNGRALYFSRSVVPFARNNVDQYFKHIGLYAFSRSILNSIKKLTSTSLEQSESLEQLRWLENGISIQVTETKRDALGVDTAQDLKNAQKVASNQRLR
jgi:3-deoxy-manno-octulosonate cytidylyltransferase (CMP-KDO synthetase)